VIVTKPKISSSDISDYSTKVKNLTYALASIGTPVDDEDLMAITSNGLGKDYSQFHISIAVRKTFSDFQDLITLLISEEMRIVGTSSNGRSQESVFYSNTNIGRGGKNFILRLTRKLTLWTSST